MTSISGLPAHALLVHFIVVLAPLTAVLTTLCAVWPQARKRLAWLVLGLAVVTVVLTPLTTDAGEWLEHQVGPSPQVHEHAELGDTMIYFAVALLVAAALVAVVHAREVRGHSVSRGVVWAIAAMVVGVSMATTVQVYRIGDSGARATWGDQMSALAPTHP